MENPTRNAELNLFGAKNGEHIPIEIHLDVATFVCPFQTPNGTNGVGWCGYIDMRLIFFFVCTKDF
jgi:hypothetical protein